jgi:glycosyltransferase involved in cell wall biosynthesis
MTGAAESARLIGVAVPDVSDWVQARPAGKWSQFFGALSRRMELVDVVQPRLSRAERLLALGASFHPHPPTWRGRAKFNAFQTRKLSASAERELSLRAGSYDLVVLLQTMCAPGEDLGRPYVVYTDNTFALSQRFYARSQRPLSRSVRWRLEFEAEVCRAATAVFTFSEFARQSMIEDYGCSPARVEAIGAGANQLLPSPEAKRYGNPVALFVGVDFARKGGPTLLTAWREVQARLPGAELLIAGPRARPPKTLGPGVRWLGRVDRERLEELYTAASVFVLPSIFDPHPFVFAEAMGHGLACIGSTCCAMPEQIEEGVTGRLVPPNQHSPLAEALIELLSDPAKARRMGQAGYRDVIEQRTWDRVAERFVSHLAALDRRVAHTGS